MLCLVVLGGGGYYAYTHQAQLFTKPVQYKTAAENDPYVRFDMEVYDAIVANYWKQATSSDMAQLFQLSVQKAGNFPAVPTVVSQDRTGVANMIAREFKTATSTSAEKNLAINTVIVALYNLAPQGRDQLLSSVQETELRQTVANINPANDLYQNIGVTKGATMQEIAAGYMKTKADLAHATTSDVEAKREQTLYSYQVLNNPIDKSIYDQTQIEPTVFGHIMGNTLYVYIEKISPSTISDFARVVDSASTTPHLSSMILDVRNNVGGDLTFPQYFLGLFLGQNQYAFDLFHQGDYQTQRTVTPHFPELDRYTEYAVLTNNMTQSTAELLTSILKKFRIAHVVGTKTRGWGSVENTYPIQTSIGPNEKYSLLLVNSLTLRDDNQPIEVNGVLPDVDIQNSQWKQILAQTIRSTSLQQAIINTITVAPQR